MVRCIYENCKTCAHYGVKNGNPLYCYFHKIKDSFFINSRKCIIGDCTSVPHYGYKDDICPTYCNIHRTTEMTTFHQYKCKHDDCEKVATYGYIHNRRRIYCKIHKADGMEFLIRKKNKCMFIGCNNDRGSNTSYKLCDFHAPAEKEDYTKCITVHCKFIPSFGYKEGKPICCALHKHKDMMCVVIPTMKLDTKKITTTSVDATSVDGVLNTALLLFNSLAFQIYHKEDVYEDGDEELVWISKKELQTSPKKRVRFKL